MKKGSPKENLIPFIEKLRNLGVQSAKFDSDGNFLEVSFMDVSHSDIQAALDKVQEDDRSKMIKGLDPTLQEQLERKYKERDMFWSS